MENNIEKSKYKILIIDDEKPIREVLAASLQDEGYPVETAHDGESGLKALATVKPDIVLLDIWMPGKKDGIEVLKEGKKNFPDAEFIMISGHGTIETAVKATKLGAWDFIEKPLSMDKIQIVIHNIINYHQEKIEKEALLNKLRKSIAIIGDNPHVMQIKQFISKVAPTHAHVLLQGEDGVGKNLIAQNIHYMSHRVSRPFIEINCSSIPEDLLEAELFGIEKGAMPGVDKTRKGKLELAKEGTLLIKEISEMNQDVQAKLNLFLIEKKLQRIGGSESIACDTRIIAASKMNLEKQVNAGAFLKDLLNQLSIVTLDISSLKDRKDDIPALISYFSDQLSRESGYLKKTFSEQAIKKMQDYQWPGNIRELKNFLERIYILTPSDFVDVHDLRFAGLSDAGDSQIILDEMSNFRDARAKFEKEYLIKKISENGGNISKTAEVIGLERSYLHRKIKAYNIEVE